GSNAAAGCSQRKRFTPRVICASMLSGLAFAALSRVCNSSAQATRSSAAPQHGTCTKTANRSQDLPRSNPVLQFLHHAIGLLRRLGLLKSGHRHAGARSVALLPVE